MDWSREGCREKGEKLARFWSSRREAGRFGREATMDLKRTRAEVYPKGKSTIHPQGGRSNHKEGKGGRKESRGKRLDIKRKWSGGKEEVVGKKKKKGR